MSKDKGEVYKAVSGGLKGHEDLLGVTSGIGWKDLKWYVKLAVFGGFVYFLELVFWFVFGLFVGLFA